MEFLYWKTDSTKVRLICKKFKTAWDMHLVNLAQSLQVNLYDNYNEHEIEEGERLLQTFVAKMSKNKEGISTIEGFCIEKFNRLKFASNSYFSSDDPTVQMLALKEENHYMYALCLNAIISVMGDQRNYKLMPYHLDYAGHLTSVKYYGDKPCFANILKFDTYVNLKRLPLGRLQYFLRFVERYGPTLEEVVNFIKTKLLVRNQRQQSHEYNKELMMLTPEQLIRMILIMKTH